MTREIKHIAINRDRCVFRTRLVYGDTQSAIAVFTERLVRRADLQDYEVLSIDQVRDSREDTWLQAFCGRRVR